MTHTTPGTITDLPYAWRDDEWKATAMRSRGGGAASDSRTARDNSPVYQCDADRQAAEAGTA